MFVAAIALCAPIAALADTAPTPSTVAAQTCKAELAKMGAQTFAQTYANFGACVQKNKTQATADVTNAGATCKAEQADANFAAAHGGKTFDQYYGSNTPNDKSKGAGANAYGKCVSQHAQQASQQDATKAAAAAKTCKAMLKNDPTGFATKYGKTRNAFGKCVAAKGK
jgi:hypothetical protein